MKRAFTTNRVLWVLQGLLAVLFLMAGSSKFLMPPEVMTANSPLSLGLIRFIGAAEILGAAGLILPWALRIKRELTPLAAVGLVIIMTGATALTAAIFPAIVGVLAGTVAYTRARAIA
jgi:hypothetical protein